MSLYGYLENNPNSDDYPDDVLVLSIKCPTIFEWFGKRKWMFPPNLGHFPVIRPKITSHGKTNDTLI